MACGFEPGRLGAGLGRGQKLRRERSSGGWKGPRAAQFKTPTPLPGEAAPAGGPAGNEVMTLDWIVQPEHVREGGCGPGMNTRERLLCSCHFLHGLYSI